LVALVRARWEEGLLTRVREELQAEGVRLVAGQAYTDAGLRIAVPVGRLDPLAWVSMAEPNDEAGATWRDWLLPQIAALALSLVLAGALLLVHHRARQRHSLLMQRQQDFITRVTHELKTPLAGIRLMAENLQMGAISDPPTARQFLGRILAEASNLGQRIDEVLKVARDRRPSQLVPVRLDELAAEVVAQWQPRFQQKAGELRADLRPCALTRADPELLRDALSNLLDNALKYGREGFRTECVVRTTEMGRWVVLDVSDNGMGVPADMRRAIFERFTRVERSGRGKSGGHGLGLAFVAETVAALSGTVDCFEGTEGGARFRIKLRKM
jgi:signal transduction histidine kinase